MAESPERVIVQDSVKLLGAHVGDVQVHKLFLKPMKVSIVVFRLFESHHCDSGGFVSCLSVQNSVIPKSWICIMSFLSSQIGATECLRK